MNNIHVHAGGTHIGLVILLPINLTPAEKQILCAVSTCGLSLCQSNPKLAITYPPWKWIIQRHMLYTTTCLQAAAGWLATFPAAPVARPPFLCADGSHLHEHTPALLRPDPPLLPPAICRCQHQQRQHCAATCTRAWPRPGTCAVGGKRLRSSCSSVARLKTIRCRKEVACTKGVSSKDCCAPKPGGSHWQRSSE
jgi:hypothetical protein